jgi:uncharacterized protein YaeQ
MALAPTLYAFQVSLNQVDKSVERELQLKVARHPSESLERLWLRVLAYCWQWEERLEFGAGLSDPDAPDLWARDYTGLVTQWIRVGKADPAKIQRAVDQNPHAKVSVLFESPDRLEAFLHEARDSKTARAGKADLAAIDTQLVSALASSEERRCKVTVTFVGDHFYVDYQGKSLNGPLTRGSL